MRPTAKLSAYALALAATFGLGAGIGAAVGPLDVGGDDAQDSEDVRSPFEHDEGHAP